jgi:AcrR family transcriptional regulator
MARTKEFDPEAALQKAVGVFWRLGYERTSLDMLMRAMGISKQSLYDTFGDKRSIYFRAMYQYRKSTNDSLRELFERAKWVCEALQEHDCGEQGAARAGLSVDERKPQPRLGRCRDDEVFA